MLANLLESRAARARRAGGTAASVAAHAALIALAVVATGDADEPPDRGPERVYRMPSLPAPAPAPPAAPAPRRSSTGRTAPVPAPVPAPADRIALPPVGPIEPALPGRALDDLAGEFARGGLRAADGDDAAPAGGGALGADDVGTEATVERAVVPLPGNAPPRYPEALRAASVEGRAVARFVVDTLGRVEPGSVAVVRATDPAFAAAVAAAVPRMRFVPAEARGRRVRQLVEQPFEFRLGRP